MKGGKHKQHKAIILHMSGEPPKLMPTTDSSHDDNRCMLGQHANDIIENIQDSVLDAIPFFLLFDVSYRGKELSGN